MAMFSVLQHAYQIFIQKPEKEVPLRIKGYFTGLALTGEATLVLLLFTAILMTSYDLVGTPMKCYTGNEKHSPGIDARMDTTCMNSGTYTIDIPRAEQQLMRDLKLRPKQVHQKLYAYTQEKHLPTSEYEGFIADNGKRVIPVIHPGIPISFEGDWKYKLDFSRYKWSPLLLIIQALCFAFPIFMWKSVERGIITRIIQDLHLTGLVHDKRKEQIKFCALQILKLECGSHYVLRYYIIDILNVIQIPVQFYLTHLFLNRKFLHYGPEAVHYLYRLWLNQDLENEVSPMEINFPRYVKCDFYSYGTGGGLSRDTALCNLSMHDLMSKVMLFLWFWYAALFLMCGATFIYNVMQDLARALRTQEYKSMIRGQLLLLRLVRINVDDITFSEIVKAVEVNAKHCQSKKDQTATSAQPSSGEDVPKPLDGSEDKTTQRRKSSAAKKDTVIEMGPMGDICGNNLVRSRPK